MKVTKSPITQISPDTGTIIDEMMRTKITAEYETVKVGVTITSTTDAESDGIYKDVLKVLRAFEDGNQLSMFAPDEDTIDTPETEEAAR